MTFAERIRHLTPAQRSVLLERLGLAGVSAETELIAYVVPHSGSACSPDALRAHCRSRLPEFMIPAQFVPVAALPRHPNGKLNRTALPAPATLKPACDTARPQNEIESEIARIWGELLHLEKVGVNDNFFRLGGHSLLALQVMARVRDTFKVNLPLKALFEAPTVAGLASTVSRSADAPQQSISKIPRRPSAIRVSQT